MTSPSHVVEQHWLDKLRLKPGQVMVIEPNGFPSLHSLGDRPSSRPINKKGADLVGVQMGSATSRRAASASLSSLHPVSKCRAATRACRASLNRPQPSSANAR